MALYAKFGMEIRRQRELRNLSQEDFAALVGVSRTTVGYWERGSKPRAKSMKLLRDAGIITANTPIEVFEGFRDRRPRDYTIFINAPRMLLAAACRFGVLHVRNGTTDAGDHDDEVNQPFYFNAAGDRGEMNVTINTNSRKGFEFKCFVEFVDISFERVEGELQASGFREPSLGEGKAGRAWFLLRDYRVLENARTGIRNNFYFPE